MRHQLLLDQGRCSSQPENHHLFFSERVSELERAQQICSECSVKPACLALALESEVEWGVWGGFIFWDGRPMLRKRGRGRPRHGENIVYEVELDQLEKLAGISA